MPGSASFREEHFLISSGSATNARCAPSVMQREGYDGKYSSSVSSSSVSMSSARGSLSEGSLLVFCEYSSSTTLSKKPWNKVRSVTRAMLAKGSEGPLPEGDRTPHLLLLAIIVLHPRLAHDAVQHASDE